MRKSKLNYSQIMDDAKLVEADFALADISRDLSLSTATFTSGAPLYFEVVVTIPLEILGTGSRLCYSIDIVLQPHRPIMEMS